MCMWRAAGAMCAQIHSELSICDQTTPFPISPSLPVQWQLCCPQRDDWESVALPLQSYRSTAAGVSSSALPLCSLPRLFPSPPFVSLLKSYLLPPAGFCGKYLTLSLLSSLMLGLIILTYQCVFQYFMLCYFFRRFLTVAVT